MMKKEATDEAIRFSRGEDAGGSPKERRNTMSDQVRFEDMSEEEKQAAFQKWIATREGRKVQSSAKRKAVTQLVNAHKAEYNKLLVAAGGTVPRG